MKRWFFSGVALAWLAGAFGTPGTHAQELPPPALPPARAVAPPPRPAAQQVPTPVARAIPAPPRVAEEAPCNIVFMGLLLEVSPELWKQKPELFQGDLSTVQSRLKPLMQANAVSVMTSPILMLQDGQTGFTQVEQLFQGERIGNTFRVTPQVEKATKMIHLEVEATWSSVAPVSPHRDERIQSQIIQNTTRTHCKVADGASLCIPGPCVAGLERGQQLFLIMATRIRSEKEIAGLISKPASAVPTVVPMTRVPAPQQTAPVVPVKAVAPAVPAPKEIAIECRRVLVPDAAIPELYKQVGIAAQQATECPDQDCCQKPVTMTQDQLRALLEKVQGVSTARVVQMPRVVANYGEAAEVRVGDDLHTVVGVTLGYDPATGAMVQKVQREVIPLGIKYTVKPVWQAGAKTLAMTMVFEETTLQAPVEAMSVPGTKGETMPRERPRLNTHKFQAEFTVRPETSAVFLGRVLPGASVEPDSSPITSKVPYVNRLFRNTNAAQPAQREILIVTPRAMTECSESGCHAVQQPACPKAECQLRDTPVDSKVRLVSSPAEPCQLKALLEAYSAACAAGNKERAAALAVQALALDPTCFSRK